jgi:hypothetical protein
MSVKKYLGWIPGALLVAALAAGGLWVTRKTQPNRCPICAREIHRTTEAVIELGGKPQHVCCVRCALSLSRQLGRPVRLITVTDFLSARPLRPSEAYYVDGTRVVLCERHEPLMDQSKHAIPREFDRCEPSVFAFASRADAQAFSRDNGGVVVRLDELMKEGAQAQ